MTSKMKILSPIVSSLLFVVSSAAADFMYQEYTKAPEVWKRGFVLGISQYMSSVAQRFLSVYAEQFIDELWRHCQRAYPGRQFSRRVAALACAVREEPPGLPRSITHPEARPFVRNPSIRPSWAGEGSMRPCASLTCGKILIKRLRPLFGA
jgi:hypothetical protein